METLSVGSTPGPTVTFWGAARAVTGSMHLVEVGDQKVLLDCGSFRGRREEARHGPPRFPFDPHEITAVVLSHSHLDHCGNLPALIRQGFAGPIYCTPATRDLVAVMLGDTARHQEEDARVLSIVGHPVGSTLPPFTRSDAWRAVEQCVTVPYDRPQALHPDVELRLADAGHILGSAMVSLRLAGGRREHSLTFTGDVGRRGLPFLREPAPVPAAEVVVCESTYAGRVHDSLERMVEVLGRVLRRSVEEGGKVLVPAFSLGRTQLVVHFLHRWMREGLLPVLPMFVDSPLAAEIADVYARYPEHFDREAVPSLRHDPDFLEGPGVHYVRTLEESKELVTRPGACILIAAGGMCEGGRILRHLKHHLDDPRCTVVLVSYQAPHTLGRKLLEPRPRVRFHGKDWNLWAEVIEVNGFSGHAGHDELLAMLRPLAGRTRRIRLVHGEWESAQVLAEALTAEGFPDVAIPAPGESVSLA
jgi:metallo-beta-lactamase family protein